MLIGQLKTSVINDNCNRQNNTNPCHFIKEITEFCCVLGFLKFSSVSLLPYSMQYVSRSLTTGNSEPGGAARGGEQQSLPSLAVNRPRLKV